MLRIIERHMAGEVFEPTAEQRHYFEARRDRAMGNNTDNRPYQNMKGVGILPIVGPIFGKANLMTEMSGSTSIESSREVFRMMMGDEDVHTVLMDVDSPGGSSNLVQEFADEIFASRGEKPIYSIANTAANSAAYWLASQADRMYVTPSGQVGSVGVFLVHEDQSKADQMAGKKFTYISAGEHKTEGNSHTPLSEDERAHVQELVNELYGNFQTSVSKGRGISVQNVDQMYGGGRVYTPKMALERGMVDGILSQEQLVTQLSKGPSRPVTINHGGQKIAAMIQGNQVYALENKFDNVRTATGADMDVPALITSWLVAELAPRAEHKEEEHSEPGTGSPPEPRKNESGEDDIAIVQGWRRNPLPVPLDDPGIEGANPKPVNHNVDSNKGGEKKVDLTQEQLETLCNALGVQPSQFFVEAQRAIGEVTALRSAGAQASEEERFRAEFPAMYEQWQEDRKNTQTGNAQAFIDSIKMFKQPDGQEMKDSGFGLSALAIDAIAETHVKFATGVATVEDYETSIKTIANGGVVDYSEKGSSRAAEKTGDEEWNTTSFAGLAAARRIAAQKLNEIRAEAGKNEPMTLEAAITELGKREPDLLRAYKMTKPEEVAA